MRPVAGGPLLERQRELEQLELLAGSAAGGRGRGAFVFGPAGIGKTRLLEAVRDRARALGLTCLTARAAELELGFPYGVARQLFEGPVRKLDRAAQEAVFAGAAGLAAGAVGFDEHARETESPFSVVHGLYWLCATLAEESPLLVAVDDLHWADEPSLQFLAYLIRRVEELPVLVVVAARPAWEDGRAELVDQVVSDPSVVRIDLPVLSPGAVADLVRDLCGDAPTGTFLDAFYQATGGNPFLCVTLAAAVVERGARPDDAAGAILDGAGREVSVSVSRRLGRLPERAASLAQALSVVGAGDGGVRRAAAVAHLALPDAWDARDTLADQGILTPVGGEFVHPLVRSAVYEAMPSAQRARFHLDAARLLVAEDAPPERVALHLLATEPQASSWVVGALRTAAQAVLRHGEPAAAVTYLRRALTEPPDPGEWAAAVLLELGIAEFRAGQVEAAAEHLQASRRLEADAHHRVDAGRELGFALFQAGRYPEAVAVQTEVLGEAVRVDQDLAWWIEAERHQSAVMHPRLYPQVTEGFDLATELGGDTAGERALLAARATAGGIRGEPPAATVVAWASRAIDKGLLQDSMSSSSGIWVNGVIPLILAGAFDAAGAAAETMVVDARRRGAPVAAARAHMVRALLNLRRGPVDDAEADARLSWELGLDVGYPPSLNALGVLVEALVERGEHDAADAVLRDAGRGGRLPSSFIDNWVLNARGRLRLAQGRLDDAVDDFRELGRRGEQGWHPWNPAVFAYRSSLALALWRRNEPGEARRLAEEELRLARRWAAAPVVGLALRTVGQLFDGARGLALLAESTEILGTAGARIEHARSLVELGAAMRRAGRNVDARSPLQEAREQAHACGAVALAAQALDELHAAGARPRRIALTGADALTPSERRVARLAADGMTNREIAQALFVTLRTVEVHLTHCYQKLGISSRYDLGPHLAS